jgi:uncharacterized protein (UPF0276 family)
MYSRSLVLRDSWATESGGLTRREDEAKDSRVQVPAMPNRFDIPNLGIGIGLRATHYAHILETWPVVDWFEILSDNYMQTSGRPLRILDAIADRYPVAMHGISMSIGSTDPIDRRYVDELRALRERTGARWVSDHLCFTGVAGRSTHDLLPLPYTEEALHHVIDRVRCVQDILGMPLALENPSSYLEYAGSSMKEWEFLGRVAEEADSALLLDVNNVFVSGYNHGYDPMEYLAAVPYDRVVQLHVAGHTHRGTHIVDSHIGPVHVDVWRLLRDAYTRAGGVSILLEWDAEIPAFAETHAEALRAKDFIDGGAA